MEASSNHRSSRPKSRQSIAHLPSTDKFNNDKENSTADISSMERQKESGHYSQKKKSRSKSLGPGGIEALKENAGNAVKTSFVVPRSILKPTVPITPPKAIPTFEASRRKSPRAASSKESPGENGGEDLLIDFSTPAPNTAPAATVGGVAGARNIVDPFSPLNHKSPKGATVPVRTEEQQEAAAREREAAEQRDTEKKAILEQRAARRKSMANRRVSFAPEATLHTWNVIELAEDSTTSSASNSTRRQSSMTAAQSPALPSSDPPETPSTPPAQAEEPLVKASPAQQRDVHQKKRRRRSSGIPPMNFNNPDDDVDLSSSPFSGRSVAGESSPIVVDESVNSDDDSGDDNDTAMSIDDATGQSKISVGSSSSTRSSLDERLEAAATLAGTRGIDYDENGDDVSMELASNTITNAFQPWANKGSNIAQDLTSKQDQENVNPFSPAFKAQLSKQKQQQPTEDNNDTEDMSMDVTVAVGGILPSKKNSPSKGRRKSVAPSGRRNSIARRRSSGEASMLGDETMELTMVGGGILAQQQPHVPADESIVDDDEDMTMEFTNVIGGVLSKDPLAHTDEASFMEHSGTDETMDMTVAIGGILTPIEEQTEPITDEDETQTMDVTHAMGAILPPHLKTATKPRARQVMEEETDEAQLHSSPFQEHTAPVSLPKTKTAIPEHVSTSIASETGSPSLALKPRLSGRRTPAKRQSTTPKSTSAGTPVKASPEKVATPAKQMTPKPGRPDTPEKTPIMSNVTYRSASPKKLFKAEIKAKASPGSAQKSHKKSLFSHDTESGTQTPSVVLAPKPHQHLRRRSSGLGIDKEGMGSPRVSALLERRGSIGEGALTFVPDLMSTRGLRFEDPRQMAEEVDADREEEERRESGRFIMEQEADIQQDEDNATLQLKEMIESMTPKKNKLKGRKSLHVGAARGLLGKRPVELDLDDDDEEADCTPKRLKAIERPTSPVKKIHLPAPPSKVETTGRMTRGKRRSLEETTTNVTPIVSKSPRNTSAANTLKPPGRYKDAPPETAVERPISFEGRLDNVIDAVDAEVVHIERDEAEAAAEEKVHLQDFLNMTNIHFMELNTTKRRHTVAPAALMCHSVMEPEAPSSLEDCVLAATTTLPLLELYQHACRELKAYISSGRRIIRSIEEETLEEQPALFREYLDAKPDVKMVMDNQFRNGKVNARLQSKGGWYAWRSQLVDGLKGGLDEIHTEMLQDGDEIAEQEEMLAAVLPGLEQRNLRLETVEQGLLKRKEELESEDHEALREARARLADLEVELARKDDLLNQLQNEMQEKEHALSEAAELKTEFQSQIEVAERVQEECRGWSFKDVRYSKEKVEKIENSTGWKIVSAEVDEDYSGVYGPAITMRYLNDVRLFYYPAAFQEPQQNRRKSKSRVSTTSTAPISLTYSPIDESALGDLSTEKRFMLQYLRSQLHTFALQPRGSVSPLTLLSYIKYGWDLTGKITEEIRLLQIMGVTTVAILGDETLGTKCTVMLPNGKGRADISFNAIVSVDGEGGLRTGVAVDAKGLYGDVANILEKRKDKVLEALAKETSQEQIGGGSWVRAVRGFEEWVALQKSAHAVATATKVRTPKRK